MFGPFKFSRESQRRLEEARRADEVVEERGRKVSRTLAEVDRIIERNHLGEMAALALGAPWRDA